MKIKGDISGLDEFVEEVNQELNKALIDASHKSVDLQKTRNISSRKTYQNHTWNLRNAPGSAVYRDGTIIDLYVPADGSHGKAKEKTENLLIYGKHPKDGIVLADGMEYASFVQSKGYDVVDSGEINLKKELGNILKRNNMAGLKVEANLENTIENIVALREEIDRLKKSLIEVAGVPNSDKAVKKLEAQLQKAMKSLREYQSKYSQLKKRMTM